MATPTCANDAADIDSRTSPNSSVRMKRICIVIPLAHHPSLARSCSAAPSCVDCGPIFGRNLLQAPSRSQMVLVEISHSGDIAVYSIKLSSEQPSHRGISVFNLASFGYMAFPSFSVAVVHRRRPYHGHTLARRVLACLFNKAQLYVRIRKARCISGPATGSCRRGQQCSAVPHVLSWSQFLQSYCGRSRAGTNTRMDRAMPGVRSMSLFFSRLITMRWTDGGLTSKCRCISCSAGGTPCTFVY